ncbi:MAG: exodeoxyribonuclease VII small subunit [Erysipelotrichaceae bacterium]|nr:exodeoxyribonuclease VII small subunit [Erysipelotrichaceae bacterium]MDY5251875.1 exodeoxyribonuclease VII small subunit [Erysipelotrichaceae bacterium]
MSDKPTFEQAMKRLDEIVNLLEKNELSLDQTLEVFEEGLKLASDCEKQLKVFELKIQELADKEDNE